MSLQNAPRATEVRQALREATKTHHAALGAAPEMRRLFARDLTLEEYGTHLARLLGFYEPFEAAAARAAPWYGAGAYRRSDALRADLTEMGWSARALASIEVCRTLPALDAAGVRGCAYVLFGSMLGGRTIALQLRRVLGPAAPTRFYGDGTGEDDLRWTSFCSDLERRPGDLGALCAAASATFDAYAAWLRAAP